MTVAIISNDVVVNLIFCDTVEHAQELFHDATCINGEGLAIGDEYPKPDTPPTDPSNPDADRDAMIIDQEYRLTLLELGVK